MGRYLRKARTKLDQRVKANEELVRQMPLRGWTKRSKDWRLAYKRPGSMRLSK